MNTKQIKKCVVAVLAVASVCFANAQETLPDHIKEIFALAKTSAEEDFNINFCGFFTGMSRYDAQDLVTYYRLKDGEFLIEAAPGKAVSKLWFSLKGVRRITRGGSTLDELAQAVANRVGDMKRDWESGGYEHRTIDGVVVKMGREGLSIENVGVRSKKPLVTKVNAQKDMNASLVVVQGIIKNMVAIPGKNYKMGKTEVTQAQWEAVMGKNPSCFRGADNPVEWVSWNDCQEFLKKLNALPAVKESGLVFRLPTEKEWEYACRAGATGDYCKLADGTEITRGTLGEVAWYEYNSDDETHPVGQKKPNAFGLYDMHGNVGEWCEDLYEVGSSYPYRVHRGGSLRLSSGCAAGYRFRDSPDYRNSNQGFRLVAEEARAAAEEAARKARAAAEEAARKAAEEAARKAAEEAARKAEEAARKERATKEAIPCLVRDMITIPGKFLSIRSFKIGKYEVTQAQWQVVMGRNPSRFKGLYNPVEKVSWNDCQEFLKKLNALPAVKESGLVFRLPTAKEWEYACRAGSKGDYSKLADGTEITESTLGEVAWYDRNSKNETHPVGQKKPNAFGLYDMHGNVWEWCEDRYSGGGSRRVNRGGSWYCNSGGCAAGFRLNLYPGLRRYDLGFRLAADQD